MKTIATSARVLGVVAIVIVLAAAASLQTPPAQTSSAQSESTPDSSRTFLDTNCVVCHNSRRLTANLALDADTLDPRAAHEDAEVWEKVIRKVRTGAMPPASRPQPDPRAVEAFVSHLETTIDEAAARHPMVGRPVAHRLNRTEYANAIRDLLDLEVDAADFLPPDDAG